MAEENGGEDGVFSQLNNLKRATIIARIKAIKNDLSAKEELNLLQEYVELLDTEADYKKEIKQTETDLDTMLEKKYPQLTVEEIKHLLIEEKWFTAIYRGIDAIHSAVSHRLSKRVTELVERYEYTLKEVEKYTAKSSVDSVRRDMISKMQIPIPGRKEQEAITKILSNVD